MQNNITLTEDTMIELANLAITIIENKEALVALKDFEGYLNIWEAMSPGLEALQDIISQFNL